MLAVETRIASENPSRYIGRLCKHASSMARRGLHSPRLHLGRRVEQPEGELHAECSSTRGAITFGEWGRCSLEADARTLTVRVEADDEANLRRIQNIVTRDLDRFGGRDRPTIDWRQPEAPSATVGEESAG